MHIVTVWSGVYSQKYIRMIKQMVEDTTNKEVICLGYDVPLETEWIGWCAKIELFAPNFIYRPCLYLDLDTYIFKDLTQFLTPPERLTLIRDFYHPNRGNSGIMKIPEKIDGIFENYPGTGPDGNYLNQFPHDYLQDQYPDEIKSYKVDKCQETKPDCSIMCFHGKLKPHNSQGWSKEVWNSYE